MTYGIEIVNAWGTARIDGTALPYRFKEKGSFTAGPFEPATYTDTSIFAFRVDGYKVHVRRQSSLYSGRTIVVWTDAPPGTAIEWWRFEQEVTTSPTHGSGLQIYNSSGQLVYDTTTNPLVIRDAYFVNASTSTGATRNVASSRKYAFIFGAIIAKEGAAVFQGTNGHGEALYAIPTEAFYAKDNENGTVSIIKGASVNQAVRDQTWGNGTRSGYILSVDVTHL